MISILTIPLAVLIILCLWVQFVYQRLAARLARAEEARHALEELIRSRLDALLDAAATSEVCEACEAYRYGPSENLFAGYAHLTEVHGTLSITKAEPTAPDDSEAALKEAGRLYNEAAAVYNRALSRQPDCWIGGLFMLKPAALFEVRELL